MSEHTLVRNGIYFHLLDLRYHRTGLSSGSKQLVSDAVGYGSVMARLKKHLILPSTNMLVVS